MVWPGVNEYINTILIVVSKIVQVIASDTNPTYRTYKRTLAMARINYSCNLAVFE